MNTKEYRKRRLQAPFALLVCVLLCAGARAADGWKAVERPLAPSTEAASLLTVDAASADALRNYFHAQLWAGAAEITVNPADYGGVSYEEAVNVFHSLRREPDMFFLLTYECRYKGSLYGFYPEYMPDYEDAKALYTRKLGEILETVNPTWTPLQKVLYLHDYVCAHFAYDFTDEGKAGGNNNAYLMLRDGAGVCKGYAYLMKALLDAPGVNVPCAYVISDGINHIWNTVQIDGRWYHLDATWDDLGAPGSAGHSNFLLSDAVMKSDDNAHVNFEEGVSSRRADGSLDWEYTREVACDSTRFDEYFWRGAVSPLPYVNGKWYFVGAQSLQAWDGVSSSAETLLRFSEAYRENLSDYGWWEDEATYVDWTELLFLNGKLYFHTDYLILSYDTVSGAYEVLYNLDSKEGFIGYFTQCALKDGELFYEYRTWGDDETEPETVGGKLDYLEIPYPRAKDAVSPVVSANGKWYFVDERSLQVWDGAFDSFATALSFSKVYRENLPDYDWADDETYVDWTELSAIDGTLYFCTDYLILSYDAFSGAYAVLHNLDADEGFIGHFTQCVLKDGKLFYEYRTWDDETVGGELEIAAPAYRMVPGGLFGYYEDGGAVRLKLERGATVAAVSYDKNGKMTDMLFLTEAGEYVLPKAAKTALISVDASFALRCAPVRL